MTYLTNQLDVAAAGGLRDRVPVRGAIRALQATFTEARAFYAMVRRDYLVKQALIDLDIHQMRDIGVDRERC